MFSVWCLVFGVWCLVKIKNLFFLFYENGGASKASADQSPHHPLFKITEVNYTNINIRRYFAIGIAVEIPE